MPTPGQLVQAMAGALGIPAVTVTQYDRQLSEAGLRSKGGRGLSAAKVTPTDAANLLIAILGSPVSGTSIRGAAEVCKDIGALYNVGQTTNVDGFVDLGLRSLAVLPKKHTFREALATLIEGASRGESVPSDTGILEVRIYRPDPWASIRFIGFIRNIDAIQRLHALVYAARRREENEQRIHAGGDMAQERHVHEFTIETLGKLIANPEIRKP
jgi:hypothetical protein